MEGGILDCLLTNPIQTRSVSGCLMVLHRESMSLQMEDPSQSRLIESFNSFPIKRSKYKTHPPTQGDQDTEAAFYLRKRKLTERKAIAKF